MSPTHGLLGLLLQGEQHGYQLKRRVDVEFAPCWQIDFAQLYRSLAKLAQAGWVKTRVDPGAAGPERKVYALTPRGRVEFSRWLAEPATDRDEFLVKVRLAAESNLPVGELVEAQRVQWTAERARRVEAQRAAWESGNSGRLVMADAALREIEVSCAALELCAAVLPSPPRTASPAKPPAPLQITGSDDPLLARLAELTHASAQVVGSLGGLLALARHETDVAGVHLLDVDTGEYNVPFVKHLLPEEDLLLVNLSFRENGLLLAPGNPKRIRTLHDLTRRTIRLINRPRGTGTRLLLASRLRAAHIDPQGLRDWERTANTHAAVAAAIITGAADAGPGLRAVADEWGLEFIPLGEERFDLVVPRAIVETRRLQPLLDTLHDKEFRRRASELRGYDLSRSGQIVAHIK